MNREEVNAKRMREKDTLKNMIEIYCHGRHRSIKRQICGECRKLLDYALLRTEKCPFMETKTFCSACRIHCYSEEMQGCIKEVMRYAGPRLIWSHPFLAIKHVETTMKRKRLANE